MWQNIKIFLNYSFWIFLIFGPCFNYVAISFLDCPLELIWDANAKLQHYDSNTSCTAAVIIIPSVISFFSYILNFIITTFSVFCCFPTGLKFIFCSTLLAGNFFSADNRLRIVFLGIPTQFQTSPALTINGNHRKYINLLILAKNQI